ncbi:glycoside hydrolase family 43 protein [Paenibacillus sinopodophylli]|uniref:glycoside hydrolase family 43 protein n=1 Tax=Paenibacillus sinopodophylli TaxID=1837342 RepID=UPI00110D1F03|nr:glycoside hydrolase family 43 protein [Paenibacillus sinopodophylli]
MKFENPILSGCYPDPSICRVGDDYYLVNSSFTYYPGIPIFHSQDLINWSQIGHVLTSERQLPLSSKKSGSGTLNSFTGIYAPTIRYGNGRFYVISTNVEHSGNFMVWSENPEGPWSDPIYLDWSGIDPSLLFDRDGKVYLTGTGSNNDEVSGIYQAEFNPDTGAVLTERRMIWEGTGGSFPEGPHLYRIHDRYYLVIAEGGTEFGHMVTVARSENPYGPFESCPYNPVMTHRSIKSPIQATGHADLVETQDGSWWAVFLGIRPQGYPFYHHLGRETYLTHVRWTEEGWPIFGDNGQVSLEMEGPTFFEGYREDLLRFGRDDFESSQLGLHWNSLRNPPQGSFSLEHKPSWLELTGTDKGLDDSGNLTFVGRRQQDLECHVSVRMDFEPVKDGEEAGLTAYMNEKAHYEIAVTRNRGTKTILFRRRIGSLWKVEREDTLNTDSVVLSIRANAITYSFSYTLDNGEEVAIGSGECFYLSSEVAGGFTGVYFGMYATGNGEPCQTPALYDYFDYLRLNTNE